MPILELSHDDCTQLMNRLIATDPLLMKIGEQLRKQQPDPNTPVAPRPEGNGKEVRHE